VCCLEQTVINLLSEYGVKAECRREAPGVYVQGEKIASLGLRIRKSCAYHGIAFNLDMELEPFSRIHPCGMADLKMTQLSAFTKSIDRLKLSLQLAEYFMKNLRYTSAQYCFRESVEQNHGN
jgi:lipoyl(octanoyl) transferase